MKVDQYLLIGDNGKVFINSFSTYHHSDKLIEVKHTIAVEVSRGNNLGARCLIQFTLTNLLHH